MKIFHGIVEIAGQMGILCGELKKRGHIAVGYNTFHSYLGYQDHLINTDAEVIKGMFNNILNFNDIFHYHYAAPIWLDYKDFAQIRAQGKGILMHHWGNDVRFHKQARSNNPYVYTGDSPSDKHINQKLTSISRWINEAIVQDYEVLPYVQPYYKKVHVLPIAIDQSKFQPNYPNPQKKKPLILHAPTNPNFKGTLYIEKALEQLKSTHAFEYLRIEKMNNAQAIKLYKEADIIIDQILCGSYGLFSVEAMALGKPVLAYIRPDLVSKFPQDLPIINANPDNITEQIKLLLDNPQLRNQLGKAGRNYVQAHHAKDVVVDKLLHIYAQLT